MKKVRYLYSLASATLLIFSACTKQAKEDVIDPNSLTTSTSASAMSSSAAPASINVTANWEQGATNVLNQTAHAAGVNTIKVVNNFGGNQGRIVFQRWDDQFIGRTNGAGDNGTAGHAFAFRPRNGTAQFWQAIVPFAFGTRGSREAIWTPAFENPGIPIVSMGQFVVDGETGDESPVAGIIEVGDLRAIDGDAPIAVTGESVQRPGKVIFRQLINGNWGQIGRTNGAGDDGKLLAFATLRVRTSYTIAGGKITAQTHTIIPVAKIRRSNNKLRLITDLPNQNIGSSMMYEYDALTDCGPTPPVVENGFTASSPENPNLAHARWRNFRSGNFAWDIAVGQGIPATPANYSTLDFDDFYVYGPTNKNVFTFSYNPTSGDQTLSVKVGSTVNSATKNLGNLGTLNYLQLSLQATAPSSEVQFKNVVLTVGGIDYPLGNFSRIGATQDWQIRNFNLTAGFTITGDAYLIGQATSDEGNVINVRVGKRTY